MENFIIEWLFKLTSYIRNNMLIQEIVLYLYYNLLLIHLKNYMWINDISKEKGCNIILEIKWSFTIWKIYFYLLLYYWFINHVVEFIFSKDW